MTQTERVHFRLIKMPCCSHMFCSVNPRWPSFCPNCGTHIFPQVRGSAIISDEAATLKYDESKRP